MMGPGYGQGYGMMGPGYGQGHGMVGRMSVRTNVTSVKASQVTFDATNLSRSIVHEMIVVAVENPNAPLPYDYDTGQIPEKQVKMLGGRTGWSRTLRRQSRSISNQAPTC